MKFKFLLSFLLIFSLNTSFASERVKVEMDTTLGKIELELNKAKAPVTVENFLNYAKRGFYNGTIFHRVIKDFMIQGGGYNKSMVKKSTSKPIKNEASNGLGNEAGTIAMARTNDPHSATSQFFINAKNNSNLNFTSKTTGGYGYTVFGRVTKGMPIVKKINSVRTTRTQEGMRDVPVEQVVIKSVKVIN